MTLLECDLSANDEFFLTIKTLLKLYTESQTKAADELRLVRDERDSLLAKVRALQDVLSGPSDVRTSPVDSARRKRAKTTTTTTPPLDVKSVSMSSAQNESAADLMNVAFHSTGIEDDEIVAATQLNNKSKADLTLKGRTPNNHPNKENSIVKRTPIVATADVEKSPTVLTKRTTRTDPRRASDPASRTPERILSPKKDTNRILRTPSSASSPRARARTGAPKTPRRLFDSWNTSPSARRSPASPQRAKPSTSFRSKLCLANPPTRMKQSTLKFAKPDDETFYEDTSFRSMGETTRQAFADELHKVTVKLEKGADGDHARDGDGRRSGPKHNHIDDETSNDSVEEVPGNFNEIIVLDDTQRQPQQTDDRPTPSKSPAGDCGEAAEHMPGMGCKDCENYHRMLGRDISGKNVPKKFGVCSKHRRNDPCPETPPGFWNPKIIDTPESERNETPYDYRFLRSD